MKKIIYIIAMALCLSACYFDSDAQMTECESHREFVNIKVKNWSKTLSVYRYEYDGHKYILFGDAEGSNGVVHDPDCPCHEQYVNKGKNTQETSDYPDWW